MMKRIQFNFPVSYVLRGCILNLYNSRAKAVTGELSRPCVYVCREYRQGL